VLIQQPDHQAARNYWKVLKNLLAKEGSQLVTECNQLKFAATDGKQRLTDVAKAETLLRLVQSVPSPKAEPIKLWLAKVGHERMQELADPALALDRPRLLWQKHGRSEKWIQQRMSGQETRNKLTDYWAEARRSDFHGDLNDHVGDGHPAGLGVGAVQVELRLAAPFNDGDAGARLQPGHVRADDEPSDQRSIPPEGRLAPTRIRDKVSNPAPPRRAPKATTPDHPNRTKPRTAPMAPAVLPRKQQVM